MKFRRRLGREARVGLVLLPVRATDAAGRRRIGPTKVDRFASVGPPIPVRLELRGCLHTAQLAGTARPGVLSASWSGHLFEGVNTCFTTT
jgi:hypothetical protein